MNERAKNLIDRLKVAAENDRKRISDHAAKNAQKALDRGRPERAEKYSANAAEDIAYIDESLSYIPKISNAGRVIGMEIVIDRAESGLGNWRMIAADVATMAGIKL